MRFNLKKIIFCVLIINIAFNLFTIHSSAGDMQDFLDEKLWKGDADINIDKTQKSVTVSNGIGAFMLKHKDAVFEFEYSTDVTVGWPIIGFRYTEPTKPIWIEDKVKGYGFAVSGGNVEIQKYPKKGDAQDYIIELKPNQWFFGEKDKVKFTIKDEENGVRVKLECAGQVIFDYLDTQNSYKGQEGYIYIHAAEAPVMISNFKYTDLSGSDTDNDKASQNADQTKSNEDAAKQTSTVSVAPELSPTPSPETTPTQEPVGQQADNSSAQTENENAEENQTKDKNSNLSFIIIAILAIIGAGTAIVLRTKNK